MKKSFFGIMLMFLAFVSFSFNAQAGGPDDPKTPEIKMEKITVGELKALYGENIFLNYDNLEFEDSDVLLVNANPCATGTLNIPCVGQSAYIQQQAQIEANKCCCVSGWVAFCCNNGSVEVIYAEATPNSPRCD